MNSVIYEWSWWVQTHLVFIVPFLFMLGFITGGFVSQQYYVKKIQRAVERSGKGGSSNDGDGTKAAKAKDGSKKGKPADEMDADPHASIPLRGGPKGSSSRSTKRSPPKPRKPQGDGDNMARRNAESQVPAGWATDGLPPEVGPEAVMLPPEAEVELDAMADAMVDTNGFDDVEMIDVDVPGWDEEIVPYVR